jgi:hypothetical protein
VVGTLNRRLIGRGTRRRPAWHCVQTLTEILANTEKIDRSLHDQRRVLYDAHKRISAVTKGV